MTKIAPIRFDPTESPMDGLIIVRTDPVSGRYDRLRIEPNYVAFVERHDAPIREVKLDARDAEDLIHALAETVSGNALWEPALHNELGEPTYDIDLQWDGKSYHFAAVTVGADEAIQSVISIVDPLLSEKPSTTIRRSHL